jgi:hypothetical protein
LREERIHHPPPLKLWRGKQRHPPSLRLWQGRAAGKWKPLSPARVGTGSGRYLLSYFFLFSVLSKENKK